MRDKIEATFSGCAINPLQANLLGNNQRLLEFLPQVKLPIDEDDIQEEFTNSEIENICRYIIMMYDPKSPLVKNERDLTSRKVKAAELSNLGTDQELLIRIYSCEHPLIVPISVGYLRFYAKSREYAAIVATEAKYWESIAGIMTPVDGKSDKDRLQAIQVKSALSDEVEKDILRLADYESKYFGLDELLEEATKKQRISPESIAGL